jgi:hypothetical protein
MPSRSAAPLAASGGGNTCLARNRNRCGLRSSRSDSAERFPGRNGDLRRRGLPYLEVGQSSSGPISQALELGCRVIASRTHTFLQFGRYHQNMIEFFDIGNHLELAGRILARAQFNPRECLPVFNVETNKAVYLAANGGAPRVEAPAANSRVRA